MKLIKGFLLIILVVIITALLSYQLLQKSKDDEDNKYLDSRVKNELKREDDLSDLIVEEKNRLRQKENYAKQNIKRESKKPDLSIKDSFELRLDQKSNQIFDLDFNNLMNESEEPNQLLNQENDKSNNQDKKLKEIEEPQIEKKEDVNTMDNLFLGIKDGYVAVYRGDVLEEAELIEVKKEIPLKDLSKEDIKRLQLGIEVENKRELFSILEGFLSAKN